MRPPGLRGLTIATLILALLLAGLGLLGPNLIEYLGAQGVTWEGLCFKGLELIWDANHPWHPLYKVDLPQGGSLVYKLRDAGSLGPGPVSYVAQVDWQTPGGKSYSFDAGGVYTRHPDVEFRLRDDRQAVWAVVSYTGRPPEIDFVLDLVTGKLGSVSPAPEWATVDGGRRLKKHLISKE